jgi:hypothetical protein
MAHIRKHCADAAVNTATVDAKITKIAISPFQAAEQPTLTAETNPVQWSQTLRLGP